MNDEPCPACGSTQHYGFSCKPDLPPEPPCWCEWVDIGVGEQRVAETPGCPQHCPEPDPWPEVQPVSQPPCDWDPNCPGPEGCPLHGLPRCVGCGDVADHGTSCIW